MNESMHKDCFGAMLPELAHLTGECDIKAKVFGCTVRNSDGLGPPDKRVTCDHVAWDDCRNCREFDSCYRLCMARIAMETAVTLATR